MENSSTNDATVLAHYKQFFRKLPDEVYNFEEALNKPFDRITVMVWEPENRKEQDWIFATMGMSELPMPYPSHWTASKSERRVELFLHVNEKDVLLASLLVELATYPFKNGTFLDIGHSIRYEKEFIPGSKMNSILLTYPYFEPNGFRWIHSNRYHIGMLWVIPIYESERQYKIEHGYQALEDLFRGKEVDTSDLTRAAVI